MIKMSLEVEMSTDVNNLPTTSDSDTIDQNELVDKILAEMNSKTQNTSDNPNNLDNANNSMNNASTEIPMSNSPPPEKANEFEASPKPFNLEEVSTTYKPTMNTASRASTSITTNITNIPYRTIIYSTILSVFLYLLFTSKLATNILQQIPYMYNEDNRTVLGGFLALGLFGFISLIGNYYIQLQF